MSIEYKFVSGRGDPAHAKEISAAAKEGFTAVLMVVDSTDADASAHNRQIVVLMEKRNP